MQLSSASTVIKSGFYCSRVDGWDGQYGPDICSSLQWWYLTSIKYHVRWEQGWEQSESSNLGVAKPSTENNVEIIITCTNKCQLRVAAGPCVYLCFAPAALWSFQDNHEYDKKTLRKHNIVLPLFKLSFNNIDFPRRTRDTRLQNTQQEHEWLGKTNTYAAQTHDWFTCVLRIFKCFLLK